MFNILNSSLHVLTLFSRMGQKRTKILLSIQSINYISPPYSVALCYTYYVLSDGHGQSSFLPIRKPDKDCLLFSDTSWVYFIWSVHENHSIDSINWFNSQ